MKRNKFRARAFGFFADTSCVYFAFCLILSMGYILLYSFSDSALSLWLRQFDFGTFFAVVIAFALNNLVSLITKTVRRKSEDETKLTTDYDRLMKNYGRCNGFVFADNRGAEKRNIDAGMAFTACKPVKTDPPAFRIPAFDVLPLSGKDFLIEDSLTPYEPNQYCVSNMKELSRIHEFSRIYNRTLVRVDDVKNTDSAVILTTSRTKYYYSLMTNRAIDYRINGISYRERFEEGPFVRGLRESTLSNHLGFNGYLETSDGYFIFIFRHSRVSIGKNTLQNSVGASLKTEFALNDCKKLTVAGIENAILKEITDEIRLKNVADFESRRAEIFGDFSFSRNVLWFYRDLIEGGKPQLMFYLKLGIGSAELMRAYTCGIKNLKKQKDRHGLYCAVDGYKMLLVKREELGGVFTAPDCFAINGRAYRAMPSAVATLQLMKNSMEETCR